MPSISLLRPSWRGFSNIHNIVIFGDSYSDVGYNPNNSPHPTEDQPLGVEFPGHTFAEPGTPNWVGHLVANHIFHGHVLVYDYAVGGDTVSGVRQQIRAGFLPSIGRKPEWAPWSPTDTLFITWVGINDCGWADEEVAREAIKQLLDEQECLYEAGARNFLLIDVPPIQRTPVGLSRAVDATDIESLIYEAWNIQLQEKLEEFYAAHSDISMLLFSSWDTFTRVLDNPVPHGFSSDDVSKSGGGIWVDYLHPTSQMHDWIAGDLAGFLNGQPPHKDAA